ncbi:MAG: dodecin domain-containing protein [Firmicutes bacterium]|nr:dodecin domain-containing protein [Dethiobacter sp.]MBS3889338.1 dodecin domain-containing protein [Bacillota bacterium]MBS4055021.1 dodecin domain-containing protein [Thermaerobacter sp.]
MAQVVKVLELVGDSTRGWQEAIENAVQEAARTVDNITGVEVYNMTGNVERGHIVEYKANVKVAFLVEPQR